VEGRVPERLRELYHVGGGRVEAVVADVGWSAADGAVAAQVGRDRSFARFAKALDLPPPGAGGLGEAVQQNGQRAIGGPGAQSGEDSFVYLDIQVADHVGDSTYVLYVGQYL
jgi:hypothetical protein